MTFRDPDWGARFDPNEWIRAAPKDATAKGMFMTSLVDIARHYGAELSEERFHRFQDYPLTRWFSLAMECRRAAFAQHSGREGLRRIGRAVYPMFFDTMVGKAIFAVAGASPLSVMKLASRAYEISINPGSLTLGEHTDRRAVLHLRDIYSFCDTYQVGIWEGVMETLRLKHTVRIQSHSLENVDLEISW
jgi:uncharacterized protein (TIGR02265 family)